MTLPDGLPGPHQALGATEPRALFTLELFDRLWADYVGRVPYAAVYQRLVAEAGGRFVNDHIAFRTFACQRPNVGIACLARLFQALGYRAAACYNFDDKHLAAVHLQHSLTDFPKLFISEIQTWRLPRAARERIQAAVSGHREPLSDETLAELQRLEEADETTRRRLLDVLLDWF